MVEVFRAFAGMGNQKKLYASDELHLNDKGYAHWNKWTKSVLADESGCSRWMDNACVLECEDTSEKFKVGKKKKKCRWAAKKSKRCDKKLKKGGKVKDVCP